MSPLFHVTFRAFQALGAVEDEATVLQHGATPGSPLAETLGDLVWACQSAYELLCTGPVSAAAAHLAAVAASARFVAPLTGDAGSALADIAHDAVALFNEAEQLRGY